MTTQTQYDLVPANGSEFELSVTQVPDEQHIRFWPQHFGTIPQWITLEPRIFAWMDRFCDEYCGGIWSFYTLSNGGAFMAPDADGVCLIEYSHHACLTECDAMTEHYYRLRDYALQHPESSAIMRIID